MGIADHQVEASSILFQHLINRTKQIVICLFLLCFAFICAASAQPTVPLERLGLAQTEFDNGQYAKALELAQTEIGKAKLIGNSRVIVKGLDILSASQISLQNYANAENTINESLTILQENESDLFQKARTYLRFAWLRRSQRKFGEALQFCKLALGSLPSNREIQAEYYLNVGRILFSSGLDYSAIIWLEKAERLMTTEKVSSTKLDTFRFLSLAWSSKLDYPTALMYAEKWVSAAEGTRFKYKYRQALFESSTVLSATGQKQKAFLSLKKGLATSIQQNHGYQTCHFLSSLLLNSLVENDLASASTFLDQLEKYDVDNQFSFEATLGKAIVSAYKGQHEESDKLFSELDRMEKFSDFILPRWKIMIAERNKDWNKMIALNQLVLDLTVKSNFRDELPPIHLDFAKAFSNLGQVDVALEHLEKTLAFVEEIRQSENSVLSLSLLETYHNAYRLLAQIKLKEPQEAFELSDFLKARLLKDRIDNAVITPKSVLTPSVRKELEKLSLDFIDGKELAAKIEEIEKLETNAVPQLRLDPPDLGAAMDTIAALNGAAVISYFVTLDKNLTAFVWEKDKPLRTVYLPVTEAAADIYTKKTHEKIKDLTFFKKDGRELYDKLLKPLNISAKHLIVVPDKSLWKIPFQALSPDGKKYLIETTTISYAPSVSVLLEQLKSPKPTRKSMQAFASPSYKNEVLQYVNSEANSVSELYNSKPLLNATVADFERISDKFDILHFSMHAQVSNDQPLESFLAFKQFGNNEGRLTVEDLLKVKLKKGSLVFLASCDTNNVLNGEGLVSLAWAMMGSGATTVISAQWEANDKSTEIFTKSFYRFYKQGNSSSEAMQQAAIEMIKNKSSNVHEPYYWADFTLNGDYR